MRRDLDPNKVGALVRCAHCGIQKQPVGRSAGIHAYYCDHECPGYYESPRPGSLWPGESEVDFGYAVGDAGTYRRWPEATDKGEPSS